MIAFVFGCMGALFSFLRGMVLLVIAIPLGPAAVVSSILALWLIRRKQGALRGRGLAIWGGALGALGTMVSLLVLTRLFAQQFDQDQWRQQQGDQLQRLVRGRPN